MVSRPSSRLPAFPAILGEDETYIAFEKPAGVPISPDLMNQIHEKLGRGLAAVHRLDPEVGGVMLCARNKAALDALSGQFQSKQVVSTYLAMAVLLSPEEAMKVVEPLRTEGGSLPPVFSIEHALGPDELNPDRMRLFKKHGGKPAVTECRVLESFGRFIWLECKPVTGRVHQVRLHLAAIGAPVLNDPLYGDPEARLLLSDLKRRYKGRDEERPLIARLALQASELTFRHPVTKEPVTVAAPLPHEFSVALKYLRRFASEPAWRKGSG